MDTTSAHSYTLFEHDGGWAARASNGTWLVGSNANAEPVSLQQARSALPVAPQSDELIPNITVTGHTPFAEALKQVSADLIPNSDIDVAIVVHDDIPTGDIPDEDDPDRRATASRWYVHLWEEGDDIYQLLQPPLNQRPVGYQANVTLADVVVRRIVAAEQPQLQADYLFGTRHHVGALQGESVACASPTLSNLALSGVVLNNIAIDTTHGAACSQTLSDLPANRRLRIYNRQTLQHVDHPVFPMPPVRSRDTTPGTAVPQRALSTESAVQRESEPLTGSNPASPNPATSTAIGSDLSQGAPQAAPTAVRL